MRDNLILPWLTPGAVVLVPSDETLCLSQGGEDILHVPVAHACTKKLASEFLIGVLLRVNVRQIFEWRREVRKVEGTDHSYELGFAYSGGGVGQELNSTPSSGI